jgi:hypothetical protein
VQIQTSKKDVIYVVGKGIVDISLNNSVDIVNTLFVRLILSGISHTVVITECYFIKMQLTSSHALTLVCAVNTGICGEKL